jgi:hypothetical protein
MPSSGSSRIVGSGGDPAKVQAESGGTVLEPGQTVSACRDPLREERRELSRLRVRHGDHNNVTVTQIAYFQQLQSTRPRVLGSKSDLWTALFLEAVHRREVEDSNCTDSLCYRARNVEFGTLHFTKPSLNNSIVIAPRPYFARLQPRMPVRRRRSRVALGVRKSIRRSGWKVSIDLDFGANRGGVPQ